MPRLGLEVRLCSSHRRGREGAGGGTDMNAQGEMGQAGKSETLERLGNQVSGVPARPRGLGRDSQYFIFKCKESSFSAFLHLFPTTTSVMSAFLIPNDNVARHSFFDASASSISNRLSFENSRHSYIANAIRPRTKSVSRSSPDILSSSSLIACEPLPSSPPLLTLGSAGQRHLHTRR